MDEQTKDLITELVSPIVGSGLAACLVAGVLSEVIVPTSRITTDLMGTVTMRPTNEETTISESTVAVDSTEGKISHDEVHAQQGEVKASTMDATAQDAEATALEDGASAVRTKAGASDIEVKALKMT